MKHFVVTDVVTGQVLRIGQCHDDDLDLQARDGERVEERLDLTVQADGLWHRDENGIYARLDPPSPTLAELKAAKWAAVKAKRAEVVSAGITIPGIGMFQTDDASMNNINQAVSGVLLAAAQSLPFTISWTLADNSVAVLDGPTMAAVGKAAGERKAACYVRSQVLWAAIEAAADEASLEAIDIGSGWPA